MAIAGLSFSHEQARLERSRSLNAGAIWRPLPDLPKSDRSRDAAIAEVRARLAVDPLANGELRNLVFLKRDPALSRYDAGLGLAERISRRDVPLQIELLRTSAGRADLRGVLRHADRVIHTSPNFSAELYRSLCAGLGDPAWRAVLRDYEGRDWYEGFLAACLNASGPRDLAALIVNGEQVLPSGKAILPQLQVRLVDSGAIDLARKFATRHGGVSPSALDAIAISVRTSDPAGAPFTWAFPMLGDEARPEIRGGRAEFEISTGEGGVLMERLTTFEPGRYAFLQTATDAGESAIQVWWQGSCHGSGVPNRTFLKQFLPMRSATSHYRIIVDVPAGCEVQQWRLHVLLGEGQGGARFALEGLSMERLTLRAGP